MILMVFRHRLNEDTPQKRDTTNIRTIAKRKEFKGISLHEKVVVNCLDFAYSMAKNSLHRENRSGGKYNRTESEVFWDTFSGKIAEYTAYLYFTNLNSKVSDLDFNIYPRGKWDSFDMIVNNKVISIKSTKHFGQLLLLETADWNENGQYIPDSTITYDYFLLVRTKIDTSNILVKDKLPDKSTLYEYITNIDIQGEITGALSHHDFVNQIMKYRYIIKQGQLLQGKIPMDATNFYIHAYDLENPQIILQ